MIQELLTPKNNFAMYRDKIATYERDGKPFIPIQEVILKDLLYQIEGTPDFVDPQKRIINVLKLQSIGKIMESVAAIGLKHRKYALKHEFGTQNLLKNIPVVDLSLLSTLVKKELSPFTEEEKKKFGPKDFSESTSSDPPVPAPKISKRGKTELIEDSSSPTTSARSLSLEDIRLLTERSTDRELGSQFEFSLSMSARRLESPREDNKKERRKESPSSTRRRF